MKRPSDVTLAQDIACVHSGYTDTRYVLEGIERAVILRDALTDYIGYMEEKTNDGA